jgi:ornithine cyclodeaminase
MAGALSRESVVEIGSVISGRARSRENDGQITVCDLTGVAVQDLMIAEGVLNATLEEGKS